MIEVRNLTKRFSGRTVLNGVNLKFETGKIHFVIGRSGAGKSCLLKLIVGLLNSDSGEIWLDGKRISQLSEEELFQIRRRCGLIFQSTALLDSLSVFENVAFGLYEKSADEKKKITMDKLALVHVAPGYFEKFP